MARNHYGTENLTPDNIEDTTKYGRVLLEALQIGHEYWATYSYGGVHSRYRFLVTGRGVEGGLRIAPRRRDGRVVISDYVSRATLEANIKLYGLKYWYTEDSVRLPPPKRSRCVTQLEAE